MTFSCSCFKKHRQTFRWIIKKLGSTSIKYVLLLVGSSRVLITIRGFGVQLYEGSSLCPAVLLLSVQIHVCYPNRVLRQYVRGHVLLLYVGSSPCPAMFEVNVLRLPVRICVQLQSVRSSGPCPAAVVLVLLL
jgi:hypothetical protein